MTLPITDPAEATSVGMELAEIARQLGTDPDAVLALQVACLILAGYSQREVRARLGVSAAELARARAQIGEALGAGRADR